MFWRRKKYFIRPQFQIKFTLLVFTAALASSLAVGLLVFHHFKKVYYHFMNAYYDQSQELISSLQAQMTEAWWSLGLVLLLFLVLSTGIGIFMSHRVAGPLYKLSMIMNKVATGELKPEEVKLAFRKNDEFKDIADQFNEMMVAVNSKRQKKSA